MGTLRAAIVAAILGLALVLGVCDVQAYTIQTATFQQGVGGYSDTVDTWWGDGAAHGSESALYWKLISGDPQTPNWPGYAPAIRFDNAVNTIPSNALILEARMTLTRNGSSGLTGENGDLIGGVTEVTGAWSGSSTSVPAAGMGNSYTKVQTVWASAAWAAETSKDIDITAHAKAWHSGEKTNYGVALMETNNRYTNIAFHSSESAEVAKRPKLTVQYLVPDPGETILYVSGPAYSTDTWLNQGEPTVNMDPNGYGGSSYIWVGRNQPNAGGNYGYGLIRFDAAQAVNNALLSNQIFTLNKAWLGFPSQNLGWGGPISENYPLYVLSAASAWTETGATWNTRDGTNAWPAAWVGGGAPPAGNIVGGAETVVYGITSASSPLTIGQSVWDVTSTTQGFLSNSLTNNGWLIHAVYGTSGGPAGGWSSESNTYTQYGRPFMILVGEIETLIPEPATFGLVALGLGIIVARKRS